MDGINIEKNFWRDDLDGRDVIVTIRCITYNHEKYIADALDGFVMQKTNFRFEAIIHDDASTDGTADIIRQYAERYPSIIKPIFEKENQYSKHDDSIDRTMIAHTRGKYIALCEGDDYWTDPYKLQKQVDFLESHPDYSMCFHSGCVKYDKSPFLGSPFYQVKNRDYSFDSLPILTASVLFKREVMISDIYINSLKHNKIIYTDNLLFLTAMECGKVRGFSENMSIYRIHSSGVFYKTFDDTQHIEAHINHWREIQNIFGKKVSEMAKKEITRSYLILMPKLFREKKYFKLCSIIIRSCFTDLRKTTRGIMQILKFHV